MAMTTRCARAFSPRWHVSCSIGVDFKAMLKLAWQSSRLSRAGTIHTDVIQAWTISLPWRMKRGITTWSNSNVQLSTKPGQLHRGRVRAAGRYRVFTPTRVGISGYPFSPGHFVSSITYRDGLTALPWKG